MNKDSKIANILGRGVEGCGVTKNAIELKKFFNNLQTYYFDFKNWSRKKSLINDFIRIYHKKELINYIKEINQYDYVFINSMPPKAKNTKINEQIEELFNKFIEKITIPIIYFNHDHNARSIKRNLCMSKTLEKSKVIFTLSKRNDFTTIILQGNPLYANKLFTFEPCFDFDYNKKKYWLDIDNKDKFKVLNWVGRNTGWKGLKEFFNLAKNIKDYECNMYGIEKSIQYVQFKQKYDFIDRKKEDFNKDKVNVYGPYINEDLMHELRKQGFVCQLSRLKDKYINMNYEYTHCELTSIGIVPIFNVEWFKNCIHRKYKIPFTQIKNSGIIWLDINNMQKTINEINKVFENKKLYDEYRNNAFKIFKEHADNDIICNELIKTINKL